MVQWSIPSRLPTTWAQSAHDHFSGIEYAAALLAMAEEPYAGRRISCIAGSA